MESILRQSMQKTTVDLIEFWIHLVINILHRCDVADSCGLWLVLDQHSNDVGVVLELVEDHLANAWPITAS